MLIVDLQGAQLTLSFAPSELQSFHRAQLSYWGFVKTSDQETHVLESEEVDTFLVKAVDFFKSEEIPYSLSPACESRWESINKRIADFSRLKESARSYKDGHFESESFKRFVDFVEKKINRRLKEHQLKAAYHLSLVGNGANFSVPGSGKTTVVLTHYEWLRQQGKVNLLFVVGPSSCFSPWRTEFELTLNRTPTYKILAGGNHRMRQGEYYVSKNAAAELYLITYQTLLNDEGLLRKFLTQNDIRAYFVIDEAHYIKQIDGSWAQSVLGLSRHAEQRCILTGTPMPRSHTDIFNLFDFLWPENSPIDINSKTAIVIAEERKDYSLIKNTLKQSVGPLFYRVRKADLGLMPAVFHPPVIINMNKYEKMIYDAIDKNIRSYADNDYLRNIELVKKLRRGRIIRLRQCSSNAALLRTSIENYKEEVVGEKSELAQVIRDYKKLETPAKLEYLMEFVSKLRNESEKVVIWANFVGTLELIQTELTAKGFYCKSIYGKTPVEQTVEKEDETRENIRNEFVEGDLNILIANPAACAESISLHKTCRNAVYYDLSYNCAQYLQSLDRIHRVGGSEEQQAHYYFLQYPDTIDKDIKDNLEVKALKMSELIDEEFAICSLDMFEDDGDEEAFNRLYGDKHG